MKIKKIKLTILILVFVLITTTGLRCKLTEQTVQELEKASLNIWGVWESNSDLNKIIKSFSASRPNINIKYRQFRYAEYEKQILSAMANRKEPDIILVHNTWIGDYIDKITPMPASVKTTTVSTEGTIKKETVIKTATKTTPPLKKIRDTYLSVVYDDLIRQDSKNNTRVYSLPLYVDSMVLFYNKDILANAGILEPPKTWDEFQQDVRLITRQDQNGRIIQSGAALGTANNVERYFDILSLLMMQLGSEMTSGNRITFNATQKGSGSLGAEALRFYTDFAIPNKDVYTWNKSMTNSISEFSLGKVAFAFGYSYHINDIRKNNPKLNFEIATVPQAVPDKAVNYASYWTPVVLNTSKYKDSAWDFITYATSENVVDSFLESTKRPPAIKSYLPKYENDFDLAPFVSQALTAKSWYRGKNANQAEIAFERMVNKVLSSEDASEEILRDAVSTAASEIGATY